MRDKRVFTILIGGEAGHGVKKAGSVAAGLLASMGMNVFKMDDYQSLIRGGHNFTVVSASHDPISSHYMSADLVVALDDRSLKVHREHVAAGGVLVFDPGGREAGAGGEGKHIEAAVPITAEAADCPRPELVKGVAAAASLCAVIGLSADALDELVRREYARDVESNSAYARRIYELVHERVGAALALDGAAGRMKDGPDPAMVTGNQAIALGAAAGGLDVYVAYPMTPASTILHYLAAHDLELGVTVVHPESEIAVANIAIGAAAAGARTAVGSSGGGFALMEEAISLAGMAEVPLLCVLSARSGPSTGVPTYTEQADLRFALNQGHGDFPRVVASPGSIEEAFYLSAELLDLAWRFQTPATLLTEKHLSESAATVLLDPEAAAWAEPRLDTRTPAELGAEVPDGSEGTGPTPYERYSETGDGVSPMLFPPSDRIIKWNSYEHTQNGITTELAEAIARMHDKRHRKAAALRDRLKGMRTVNVYGEEDGGPVIFAYGSTTGSVLEALRLASIEATVVQPIYLEPFPVWKLREFGGRDAIVVEQSVSGQFATLLAEKSGVRARAVVRRYDGRPFEPEGLASELKEVLS